MMSGIVYTKLSSNKASFTAKSAKSAKIEILSSRSSRSSRLVLGLTRIDMRQIREDQRSHIQSLSSTLPAKPLGNLGPVDRVPPGLKVLRPQVLILQVVGVLPHIHTQQRRLALHQRAILIRRAQHLQRAALIQHQPRPAAAEAL